MTDRRDQRWGPAAAAMLLLIMPLLYALSVGPAIVIFESMGEPEQFESFLEAFYSPLAELPEPFASVLDRYVNLWEP